MPGRGNARLPACVPWHDAAKMAQADLRTSGTPAHRSAAGRWPASMSSRCSESFGSEAGEESATLLQRAPAPRREGGLWRWRRWRGWGSICRLAGNCSESCQSSSAGPGAISSEPRPACRASAQRESTSRAESVWSCWAN